MDIRRLSEWQAERVYQQGIAEATAKMNADFQREWDEVSGMLIRDFKLRCKQIDEGENDDS